MISFSSLNSKKFYKTKVKTRTHSHVFYGLPSYFFSKYLSIFFSRRNKRGVWYRLRPYSNFESLLSFCMLPWRKFFCPGSQQKTVSKVIFTPLSNQGNIFMTYNLILSTNQLQLKNTAWPQKLNIGLKHILQLFKIHLEDTSWRNYKRFCASSVYWQPQSDEIEPAVIL